MPNNSLDKLKNYPKAESFEITVIKDPKMRPFLNVFSVTGQNIQQQKLGKLFGIIQVDDTSKESAYLPNMLTQIIKKEYFQNKNRDCGKSFEIALHKINLALTELTQHEIIKWMGNLNVAIGVICKNEIHFTQIGRGKILFLKNKNISIVNNDADNTEDYHPMKTFSSISAGKVEKDNKLIFTLNETFETLKEEELKRHLKTFNSDEFDNIVSSTLRNEAFNTGMIIVNIKEEEKLTEEIIIDQNPEMKEEELNFFGEKKKKLEPSKEKNSLKEEGFEEKEDFEEKKIKTIDLNKSPFENEPEIYFKESDEQKELDPEETTHENENKFKKTYTLALEKTNFFIRNKILPKLTFVKKNLLEKSFRKNLKKIDKNKILAIKNWALILIQKINLKKIKNFDLTKIRSLKNKIYSLIKVKKNQNNDIDLNIGLNLEIKKSPTVKFNYKNKIIDKIKKVKLETSSKLKMIIKKSLFKKIAITTLFLITFSIFTILIVKHNKPKFQGMETTVKTANHQKIIKKQTSPEELKTLIGFDKQIKDSTLLENNLFLLTEDSTLIKFSIRDNDKTEIILPKELKNPEYLSSLESLQMILIISKNQVYSYSPITNSFVKNSIVLPNNFEGIGAGSYLTYLYLLDKNSNQVYRYHRAPGGFGPSKSWLKENIDFQNALDIDISDSIYIAFDNGKIQKYFQGKKEKEFFIENNFSPNKIRTRINKNEIFALDKKQGKIVKLSENDDEKVFFQDNQFKDAKDFSVDFKNNKIFLITKKKELLMFNYQ